VITGLFDGVKTTERLKQLPLWRQNTLIMQF
jgi:hypothetical protein